MSDDDSKDPDATSASASTSTPPWESPYRITPDAWTQAAFALGVDLAAVRAKGRTRETPHLRLVKPSAGGTTGADPRATVWARALEIAGRLGGDLGDGKIAVWCLNDAAHSTPEGSVEAARGSCALLPPGVGETGAAHGSLLVCAHAHCEHLQQDDWLEMLVRDHGEDVWVRATEAATERAERATEKAAGSTTPTPDQARARARIVVQRRAVQRDEQGRGVGAAIERAPVPELARLGFEALARTDWGTRVFALENSNPPCMVHVSTEADRARIVTTTRAVLRGWFSGAAAWCAEGAGKNGNESHEADPPDAVVTYALESCEGLRALLGVVECPILRRDGSLLAEPGYDPATHLYAAFDAELVRAILVSLPNLPTQADASNALAILHDLVRDFPFESSAHRDTWIAGLLTMLARDAFDGPAPLFLCRANTRGSGKTLLTVIAHLLVTGEEPAMLGWSGDEIEFEKVVTSEAIAGSSCVILDNITGLLKSATLDRILTSGRHRARILGGNMRFDGPMRAVWWGSGNNVETSDDMARRTAPIELVSPDEQPENRAGFAADADARDADGETGTAALRARCRRERAHYLAAALTILRAWHVAGRPGRDLPPWGSFESWSRVVRGAIVYAGGADPGLAHASFRDQAAGDVSQLRGILAGWVDATRAGLFSPEGEPLGRALKKLIAESLAAEKEDREPRGFPLREALETLAGGEALERWRGQSDKVGKFLRLNRRKVTRVGKDSLMLDIGGISKGSTRWRVALAQKSHQNATHGRAGATEAESGGGGDGGHGGDAPNPPGAGKNPTPESYSDIPTISTIPTPSREGTEYDSVNSVENSTESEDSTESFPESEPFDPDALEDARIAQAEREAREVFDL